MPGLFSSRISLLLQTPEKGVCSDVFRAQHVPVVSRVMERNVETWIFSTIFFFFCVRVFPHLGN